ncbi:MAG: hypothetical protein ACFFC7_16355 [Candidatus Hermodarchaeota archaeon]
MPLGPMELVMWLSLFGLTFASTNMYIGFYHYVLGKEQSNPLVTRLHAFFAVIGLTLFVLTCVLCLLAVFEGFILGSPPPSGFSYYLHASFAAAGFTLFAIKLFFAYFDKRTVRNDVKLFGIIAFFAWLLPWVSSVWDYYSHVIPDLGATPYYFPYIPELGLANALFAFFLPYVLGLLLFVVTFFIRSKLTR